MRCLSDWLAVLEARGNVGGVYSSNGIISENARSDCTVGSTLGGLFGCIAAYEDTLCSASYANFYMVDSEIHATSPQTLKEY